MSIYLHNVYIIYCPLSLRLNIARLNLSSFINSDASSRLGIVGYLLISFIFSHHRHTTLPAKCPYFVL